MLEVYRYHPTYCGVSTSFSNLPPTILSLTCFTPVEPLLNTTPSITKVPSAFVIFVHRVCRVESSKNDEVTTGVPFGCLADNKGCTESDLFLIIYLIQMHSNCSTIQYPHYSWYLLKIHIYSFQIKFNPALYSTYISNNIKQIWLKKLNSFFLTFLHLKIIIHQIKI